MDLSRMELGESTNKNTLTVGTNGSLSGENRQEVSHCVSYAARLLSFRATFQPSRYDVALPRTNPFRLLTMRDGCSRRYSNYP